MQVGAHLRRTIVVAFTALLGMLFGATLALASDSVSIASGATTTINAFGTCKQVAKNGPAPMYVPTVSSAEWSDFLSKTAAATLAVCTCSLPWGGTLNDGSSVTAYSTSAPSGAACSTVSETRTCSATTLSGSYTNQSCSNGCASQTVTWNTNCSGTMSALSSGGSTSVTNTAGGYTGSITETCTNGVVSQSGASCSSAVTPGSQTYATAGTYGFTIPAHNTLTVQVWGEAGSRFVNNRTANAAPGSSWRHTPYGS